MRRLILNGTVVNEGKIEELDILIENDRIVQLAHGLQSVDADEVIDASGLHVFPGMIDDQVHFREPGLTHKGDIASESLAAVAGGITTYMDMPNVKPATLTLDELEAKYAMAEGRSAANFTFYLGATNHNLQDIQHLDPRATCGVKVFMGASSGEMLVDRIDTLEQIFAESPVLIATHCEDTPIIHQNEKAYFDRFGDDVPMEWHSTIRSEEACYASSSLAVQLAKDYAANLHVLHISTARELSLFDAGPVENKFITAEASVHYLYFSEEDYEHLGTQIKCDPAIKRSEDRAALLHAVKGDVIDCIGTGHAPHLWEEKQNTYFKAPAGLPLVQHALLSLLEHYHNGMLDLETIVQKSSHNTAVRFEIEKRGFIREGYFADLVLVDLETPFTVEKKNILYKCGWSPFEEHTFMSSIHMTLVNGQPVYQNGQIHSGVCPGQRVTFNREPRR